MVKVAPRFDRSRWLTLHDAAAHEAVGYQEGKKNFPLLDDPDQEEIVLGRLVINTWNHTISQNKQTIQLYDKQWAVLAYLVGHYLQNKSRLISSDQFLENIWEGVAAYSTVKTTIWRVRQKLLSLNADVVIENIPRTSRYRLRVRGIKV